MLLFLRKVLFYCLVILYFFVTPYTILYALGYLLNPIEIALVKTGLVSITTIPRHATVFVEGKRFSQKTPTAVRDLLPGRYHLRVFHKGYDSWEKEIEIEPEKATQLEPVLLLPPRPEEEVISTRPFLDMIPGILGDKIFAWENESLDSLWKIDLFFGKETPVGKEIGAVKGAKIKELFYEEESPVALFQSEYEGKQRFFLLEAGQEKKMAERLDVPVPKNPDWIHWDPKDASHIYFLESGNLSHADLHREKINPNIAADVLGFGVKRNRLYLLKKNFGLVETDRSGENVNAILLENETLGKKIFGDVEARYYRIKVLEEDLFLFLSDRGALICNRLPYHLVEQGVLGIKRTSDTGEDKVLFWTKKEIGFLDFSRVKNVLFEKEPEKILLYRHGQDIRQVFWAYQNSHVIFLDGDTIFLLESRKDEPYLVRPIGKVKPDSKIYYRERDHTLYFLDPWSHRLVKRKLVD